MNSRIVIACAAALMVSGAACGSSEQSSPPTSTSTRAATSAVSARVYFVRNEAVATGGAGVAATDPESGAVRALLAGPDGFEQGIGMTTAIPGGTRLLGLSTRRGVATVDLSSAFTSGGGSLSMQLRVAQVVFTLTQFDTVDTVRFHIDGRSVDTIGGEGLMVDGVDRGDFVGVTPLVLVESPVPDERVGSPLTVSGTSNTFEGTVNYTVTDPDGLVLDEGHTTATAGNGTWGTFTLTATFSSARAGLGAVMAYEISPRDGTHVNVYEVPVRMG